MNLEQKFKSEKAGLLETFSKANQGENQNLFQRNWKEP